MAVSDAHGRLVAWAGDPDRVTFMRSSAKPFQAMAVVESGAADALGITGSELALVAASHSGEPRHVEVARQLLGRAGLGAEALQCGAHAPLHGPTRSALDRAGELPNPLHHNCSGKHAGMLCACVHRGWDVRTYLRPDHPVQRRNRTLIGQVCGLDLAEMGLAIDGCGVPTFAVPLAAMAAGFARLGSVEGLPGSLSAVAERVNRAMAQHPEMVAGEGRFDTELIQATGGRVLGKSGAEACFGAALIDRGWGLALKVEDGQSRAVPIAVAEALRQLDVLSEGEAKALLGHARPLVHNYRDELVGEGRPVLQLQRA